MRNEINQIFKELDSVISSAALPDQESVASGSTGLALYNFYAGKVLEDETKVDKGGELLGAIFSNLSDGDTTLIGHSLAIGISGLFISISALVEDELIDFDIEENLSNFDDYLVSRCREELAEKKVDFLHQALGGVYYFTTRDLTDKNRIILEDFVDDIISAAVKDGLGSRFLNSSGPRSGNSYDLSIAHGLAGILLILIKIYDLGIKQQEIKPFVLDGIKYILKFYLPKPNNTKDQSLFALGIDNEDNIPQYSNMLAWCYGDMNQLLLLLRVSYSFGMDDWNDIIKNVTKRVCSRSFEESLVRDSHFCHGASGVCFLFNYLYQTSNNVEYLTAKERWLAITLNTISKDLKENNYKHKETQLLEGLVGVGLVLLSEISPTKLAWSKLLLM